MINKHIKIWKIIFKKSSSVKQTRPELLCFSSSDFAFCLPSNLEYRFSFYREVTEFIFLIYYILLINTFK